ncbi:MAG: alpha/beta hydrolase [Candidatus Obscuribacterales bacterium]|nr:alpha/beta hydrolase [Candidatus Obscuribacterales bacterium]
MLIRTITILLMMCIGCLYVQVSVPAAPVQSTYTQFKDLRYLQGSKSSAHLLDLYVPKSAKPKSGFPLIVQVHGGAWTQGDKSSVILLPEFIKAGFAVASINYRLLPEARFPAQVHDVKAAIRFLRSSAKVYGTDAQMIGAIGGSSGGQLVALAAASHGSPELESKASDGKPSSEVLAVCDIAGPSNFFTLDLPKRHLPKNGVLLKPSMHLYPSSGLTRKLLGATASEAPDRARLASPVCWISKKTPPFLIIHGEKDPVIPLSQSLELETMLRQNSVPVTLIIVPNAEHSFVAGPKVDERIISFFKLYLIRH